MESLSAADIVGYQSNLEGARGQQETRWEELARYMMPAWQGFITKHAEGEQLNEQIFDSQSRDNSKKLGAYLYTNMTGPQSKWFRIKFENEDLSNTSEGAEWLEEVTSIMHKALQDSNFSVGANEFLRCMPVFGTAAMTCMEMIDPTVPDDQFKGLNFQNVHMKELTFLRDGNGNPTTTFLTFKISAKQAIDIYGRDNLCQDILDAYEDGDTTQKWKFIHCVYPRYEEFSDYADVLSSQKVMANQKPWASVHVCTHSVEIIKEGGFNSNPRNVTVWGKAPAWGDGYGYGIGDDVLPDQKTKNTLRRLVINATEKSISPPLLTKQNNILGDIENKVDGITICKDPNDVKNLLDATNWPAVQLEDQDLAKKVDDAWLIPQMVLPDPTAGNMTAFEVGARLKEMARMLGAVLGSIEGWMKYVIERQFDIMYAKGALPEIPESVAATRLDVEYNGPLAKAARMESVQAAQMFIGMVQGLAEMNPEVIDVMNADALLRESGRELGVPENWMNGEEDVAGIRQQRAQAAEEAAKVEMENTQSGTVKNLADARGAANG